MTTITLDRDTFERLRSVGPAELLAPDGAPFATLTPLAAGRPDPELAADLEKALASRRDPTPGVPLAEAWESIFAVHGRPEEAGA